MENLTAILQSERLHVQEYKMPLPFMVTTSPHISKGLHTNIPNTDIPDPNTIQIRIRVRYIRDSTSINYFFLSSPSYFYVSHALQRHVTTKLAQSTQTAHSRKIPRGSADPRGPGSRGAPGTVSRESAGGGAPCTALPPAPAAGHQGQLGVQ